MGNAFTDGNFFNGLGMLIPGSRSRLPIILHLTLAADGQHSLLVKRPGQIIAVLAADAAGNNAIAALHGSGFILLRGSQCQGGAPLLRDGQQLRVVILPLRKRALRKRISLCSIISRAIDLFRPHLHRQQRRRQHQRQHKTDKLLHIPVLLFLSCTRGKKRETPLDVPRCKKSPCGQRIGRSAKCMESTLC